MALGVVEAGNGHGHGRESVAGAGVGETAVPPYREATLLAVASSRSVTSARRAARERMASARDLVL